MPCLAANTVLSSPNKDISEIANAIGAELSGDGSADVRDVTHDSRAARAGTLFVAIKGETTDGHRFIDDVLRRGAAGIISEFDAPVEFTGAWLKVSDARSALARAAAAVYGDPSKQLELIGITGTNGKTTTTYLCFALAEAAGKKPAMLTTVEYRIGDESEEAVRTTPEASDTNKFLREAVDAGCTVSVMEASSQAIDLHRCDGLHFKIAIFTNLTRDHLDYHGSMENYFAAKKKLFDGSLGERPARSIINIDDEWGKKLAQDLTESGQRVITTSLQAQPPASADGANATFTAADIDVSLVNGTNFTLQTPNGTFDITSPLVGRPHVYNMLSATAAAFELGFPIEAIRKGLSTCIGAPGRFERVAHDADFAVIVDYAHTDDALLNTLETARDLAKGRIITVFGCGGDRDKSKRAPMGEIAGRFSDVVIVTSDNPRKEDPLKIISEIEVGLKDKNYEVIPDRREAIKRAVSIAKKDDVIIIAGKGHETYQIVGPDKFHFDDREVAREALARLAEAV